MGFSLNEISLLGTLGRDAETRFTNNNVGVTNFSIATEHSYKDKSDEWVRETTWHNCTAFNLSDFFKDALKKGAKTAIPDLEQVLRQDPAKQARSEAAETLGRIEAYIAIPALSDATGDKAPEVRASAIWALGVLGNAAKSAIPLIRRARKDVDVKVRTEAANALNRIGSR